MQADLVENRFRTIARDQLVHAQYLFIGYRRSAGFRAATDWRTVERLTQVRLAHRGIVLYLCRGTGGETLSCIEHDDMVRDTHDQRHVMLDQYHADAGFGNTPQQLRELFLVFAG